MGPDWLHGQVRGYDFDGVMGIGGTSAKDGIAGRIVWIGIDPRKSANARAPFVAAEARCVTAWRLYPQSAFTAEM